MVQFSYYHVDLIAKLPDVADFLQATMSDSAGDNATSTWSNSDERA